MSKIRCPICKNFYDNFGLFSPCCPRCSEAQDEDFKAVREYVKQHQGANITEVSTATGVDYKRIVNYIKMEMLEITQDSSTFLKCAVCGTKLYTGMLCDECKKRHGHDHQLVVSKIQDENEKMHISLFTDSNPSLETKRKNKL